MGRFERIEVFNDTQEWIKRNKKLSDETQKTIKSTIFYNDDISIASKTSISVLKQHYLFQKNI